MDTPQIEAEANNTSLEQGVRDGDQTIWNCVTPLSKYTAMVLFVILPFVGGWIGYTYAPEKVVEMERVVINKPQSIVTQKSELDLQSATEFINELNTEWPRISRDYLDVSQPPPWTAHYIDGRVIEPSREVKDNLLRDVPSEVCESITRLSDGSWELVDESGNRLSYKGTEDQWNTGMHHNSLEYVGFECLDNGISFHFTGKIIMRGSHTYPNCLNTCSSFFPSTTTEQDIAFLFDASGEPEIRMKSHDLDKLGSIHQESGSMKNYTSDISVKTDRLVYSVAVFNEGYGDGFLSRTIRFPVNGYLLHSISVTDLSQR